jgi:hypothetical protein
MAESGTHNADKTPVFGLDELEPAVGNATDSVAETGNSGAGDIDAGAHLSLHDQLSGARLVTDRFPIEIGNGRNFDMALRGPGPDGLYARIERVDGAVRVERCHERIFLAVDGVEADVEALSVPGSFQLGEHVINLRYCDGVVARAQRKPPKWTLLAGLGVLVFVALLMRFLLSADEAEQRVTLVSSPQEQASADASSVEASAGEPAAAPEVVPESPGVDTPADADTADDADQESADSIATSKDPSAQTSDATEVAASSVIDPIVIVIESRPATKESKPTSSDSDPVTEPASRQARDSEPEEAPRRTARATSAPESTALQDGGDRNSQDPADDRLTRYRAGELMPLAKLEGALQEAHAAIEAFQNRATIEGRFRAWEDLDRAEAELGLAAPSIHQEEIRDALGEELIAAATEHADEDDERRAYGFYARAAALGDVVPDGRRLMDRLDEHAARLYRFGYRLRYSDPVTAAHYWDRVLAEVPPQSVWHNRARTALDELREA